MNSTHDKKIPHIVILGAGFGGVYVTKKLLKAVRAGSIDVTIVNRTNYFLFTPLLHEVATGALSPTCVAEPLREVFNGTKVRVMQGNVDAINTTNKTVTVSGNPIVYDSLVIATGAETNYYGIAGAQENTLPLKNLYDAARIRSVIIDRFEKAATTKDKSEKESLLSFAVVGGGATGVEMAAELAEFVAGISERYYSIHDCTPEIAKISIVDTGPELLQMFAPSLRKAAETRLIKAGVAVYHNSAVTSVTPEGLTLANSTTIPAKTVIWSAGVKAIIPKFEDIQPTLVKGRISVNNFFQMVNGESVISDIFVLGDVASYPTPLPMLAQVAEGQAATVAKNICAQAGGRPLAGFVYKSKGSMVSVGQWFAIGEIFSIKISGRITWWMWRTVYLFKFASFKKRVRIMFEWTLELFFPRDITKIIN